MAIAEYEFTFENDTARPDDGMNSICLEIAFPGAHPACRGSSAFQMN